MSKYFLFKYPGDALELLTKGLQEVKANEQCMFLMRTKLLPAENNTGWSLFGEEEKNQQHKLNTVKFISSNLDSKYVAWVSAVLNTVSGLTLSPSATAFLE